MKSITIYDAIRSEQLEPGTQIRLTTNSSHTYLATVEHEMSAEELAEEDEATEQD